MTKQDANPQVNCDGLKWKTFEVKKRRGVYMLMDGDTVQYVGQSSNIEHRVACHLQAGKIDFGWVAYAETKKQDMDLLEKQLIEKHNPPHNYTHTEKAHAERGPRVSLWKN